MAHPHRPFFSITEESGASALSLLLNQLHLSKEDLGFRLTARNAGSLALPLFYAFMDRPLSMKGHATGLHRRLSVSPGKLYPALEQASAELGLFTPGASEDTPPASTDRATTASVSSSPAELPVMRLARAADHAQAKLDDLFLQIPPQRRTELLDALEEFLVDHPETEPHKPQETRRETQQWTEQALIDLAALDRKALLEAALSLAREVDAALEEGIMPAPPGVAASYPGSDVAEGGVLFYQPRSNGGLIIVGSRDDNIYHLHRNDIVVDPGGNDVYIQEPEPGGGMPTTPATSVVVDLEGDDVYLSSRSPSQGAGVLGVSILVDAAGNDRYLARHFSQGCGLMGVGILADRGGNDTYLMDTFGQGAAGFGVGILLDDQGNDVIQGRMMVQGVGFTGGAGLLVDREGNDQYSAGQSYPDHREEGRFTKSLSQGFGMGIRDYVPGGIGVLMDCKGNDLYLADYFGQGASYWMSVGLLVDMEGNDRYAARRYVQGAGIHSSAGGLVDMAGDDLYAAWGVSQGCGHDYGAGVVWDEKGNDLYYAQWLSQGAGNSQGAGVLIDAAGDDLYEASGRTVQGSGTYNNSRGAGSIGIFLDGQGDDYYRGRGRNGAWWSDGKYGGGGDFSGLSALLPRSWVELPSLPSIPSEGDAIRMTRSYAATLPELEEDLSEPAERRRAAGELARRAPAVIPDLLSYLDMRDVFIQNTVAEAFRAMDASIAAAGIKRALESGDQARSPTLLYLLGEVGGPEALSILRSYLNSPRDRERASAMRGIWRMGALPPTGEMAHLAHDESDSARRFLARVLGRASDSQSLQILKELLQDRDYNVRFAATEALALRRGAAVLPHSDDGE